MGDSLSYNLEDSDSEVATKYTIDNSQRALRLGLVQNGTNDGLIYSYNYLLIYGYIGVMELDNLICDSIHSLILSFYSHLEEYFQFVPTSIDITMNKTMIKNDNCGYDMWSTCYGSLVIDLSLCCDTYRWIFNVLNRGTYHNCTYIGMEHAKPCTRYIQSSNSTYSLAIGKTDANYCYCSDGKILAHSLDGDQCITTASLPYSNGDIIDMVLNLTGTFGVLSFYKNKQLVHCVYGITRNKKLRMAVSLGSLGAEIALKEFKITRKQYIEFSTEFTDDTIRSTSSTSP
eukprot:219759_1